MSWFPIICGGARNSVLPYSIDFSTLGDGALPAPWVGSDTYAISSGVLINNPTLGSELLINGDFTNWTGDDPDNWTVANEDVNNYVQENPAGVANLVSDNSAALQFSQSKTITAHNFFKVQFDVDAVAGGMRLQTTNADLPIGNYPFTTGTKYYFCRASASPIIVRFIRWTAGASDVQYDDISLKQVTFTKIRKLINGGVSNVRVAASLTITAIDGADYTKQAGVSVCWNNATAPTSGVDCYHDGVDNIRLVKFVGGVSTEVAALTQAYIAEAYLEVRKSGSTFQVFYNGSQVGANQTISDVEIINNTFHGLFDLGGGSSFGGFLAQSN